MDYSECKNVLNWGYSKNDILSILEIFANSGYGVTKIVNYPHQNAGKCAGSLRRSIENNNLYHLKVKTQKGEVYLINTILVKD